MRKIHSGFSFLLDVMAYYTIKKKNPQGCD